MPSSLGGRPPMVRPGLRAQQDPRTGSSWLKGQETQPRGPHVPKQTEQGAEKGGQVHLSTQRKPKGRCRIPSQGQAGGRPQKHLRVC